MKKFSALMVVAVSALLISGCTKDSTDSKLSYNFNTTNLSATLGTTGTASGVAVAPGTNGSINWTAANLTIAKIEFNAKHGGSTIALETMDLKNINPLKPDSLAGSFALSSGIYENISFKVTMNESATNPPLILNGTYIEASGTKIPVIVQLNKSQLFSLAAPRIEVVPGTYVAKVTFELNALVAGLTANDFGQTTRTGAANTIVVNATTNRALYDKLASRFPNAATVSLIKK